MDKNEIRQLEITAYEMRQKVLRMCEAHMAGHLGGAFSCIDMVAALYFHTMNVDPQDPKMKDRDRFVLSAGHKCLAQYTALCQKGFFPEELLDTYGCLGCRMPGHPDMKKLPGIEANTGALGHGLAISGGMALGLKKQGIPARVFTIMGDGELAEGTNWEGAAIAAHYKLDNLTAVVDFNGLQIGGDVTKLMNMTPIEDHFKGFGWAVKTIDGHNMEEIVETLDSLPFEEGKPSLIVMKTVKGKGFSKAENVGKYHFWGVTEEELALAKKENQEQLEALRNE